MALFDNCLDLAKTQIALRALRYGHFPGDIFDEYAWDMMLHMYVARLRGQTMYVDNIINLTSKSKVIGDRWIRHLLNDAIVAVDGDVVGLTDTAFDRMDAYHRQALAAVA
ncbi:hypothetical protein [Sphingomonas rubra]|uniref:Uncharacterized protein n=1 Tax=Sphingomonas rubra TaxID=634430 RepID=A0A1I5SQI0_9SPHN|nr:hypothetical protein [Sphingomonas rubra]SFP72881.1 hypothetical protein SAMN04488241_10656 [Sphingomonas rubra]